jgi:splicing factor 3A subunit 3
MILEDQRQTHEDLERLEDAIAERLLEDPPHVCLPLDTEIAFPR